MRVLIVGASGNVGTGLRDVLRADRDIEVVALARRPPQRHDPEETWVAADIRNDDLVPHLRGVDVVVHLAWLIQPSRDEAVLWDVNVRGTDRLLDAVARAGVRRVVYASSIGAYSPGPVDRRIDESWPTHGIATSTYSRAKAYVERLLDGFEAQHPDVRVTRLRPGLIFSADAASEVRRLFLGSLFPNALARAIPLLPRVTGLAFQALHLQDVAAAYRLAIRHDEPGAFNVAAEPELTLEDVAEVMGARTVHVPASVLRAGAALTWRLRVHPVEPGWVDLALRSPLMDTTRIREVFGWRPRYSSREAIDALLTGLREGAGRDTPPLRPDATSSRLDELATGQGARDTADDLGGAGADGPLTEVSGRDR